MVAGKSHRHRSPSISRFVYSFGRVISFESSTDIGLSNSRSALKKYIQANNKGVGAGTTFDNQFNRAVKSGVDQNLFSQPKGQSCYFV